MTRYRCIEEFGIPMVEENGFETGENCFVEEGSTWRLDEETNYIGGQNHLESDGELRWIEISDETLERCFEEEEDD